MTALSLNDMTKRKPSGMRKNASSQADGGSPRVQKTRGFCFQFSKMPPLPVIVPPVEASPPQPCRATPLKPGERPIHRCNRDIGVFARKDDRWPDLQHIAVFSLTT